MGKASLYRIVVRYPLTDGEMRLRTDDDWALDLAPSSTPDRSRFEFEIHSERPFLYLKPIIARAGRLLWSRGANYLAVADAGTRQIYPYFEADDSCTACDVRQAGSGGASIAYRVFHPPGYLENTLEQFPVLYMHDGQNLFFPEEATFGHDWRIPETLQLLSAMNAVNRLLVVGIYPREREREYTLPGYDEHGRRLVEILKPRVDEDFRTLEDPKNTAIFGSSLGGVAALHTAWQWPDVFGMAGCLSSSFGWRDDLRERIASEPKRSFRLYLDSGWPDDNYEVTRDMAMLLTARGFEEGSDLLYFAFPHAVHNETYWATRVHLPLQFFFGRLRPEMQPQ